MAGYGPEWLGGERSAARYRNLPLRERFSRRLHAAGMEYLLELADRVVEFDLINSARRMGRILADWDRPVPQDELMPVIRKTGLDEYHHDFGLWFGFVPLEKLCGIYGLNRSGEIEMTLVGKALRRFLAEHKDAAICLVDGAAAEVSEDKPPRSRRGMPFIGQYSPKAVTTGRFGEVDVDWRRSLNAPPPGMDIDMIALNVSLQEMEGHFRHSSTEFRDKGRVTIKWSRRRPDFVRLEVRGRGFRYPRLGQPSKAVPGGAIAQMANPEFDGLHSEGLFLVHHLLSRTSRPGVVLLVDVQDDLVGVSIATSPIGRPVVFERVSLHDQDHGSFVREGRLHPTYSLVPEITFPYEIAFGEAFDHMLHQMRTIGWTGKYLLLATNPQSRDLLKDSGRQSLDAQDRRAIAIETAQFFYENLIRPVAAQPEILGGQLMDWGGETIRAVARAFNGDPLVAYACVQQHGLVIDRAIPIAGWGFFDRDGIFPQMAPFLEDAGRSSRLEQVLRKEPTGPDGHGWDTLLSFLFKEFADKGEWAAAEEVARLLTPFDLEPAEFAQKVLARMGVKYERLFRPLLSEYQQIPPRSYASEGGVLNMIIKNGGLLAERELMSAFAASYKAPELEFGGRRNISDIEIWKKLEGITDVILGMGLFKRDFSVVGSDFYFLSLFNLPFN